MPKSTPLTISVPEAGARYFGLSRNASYDAANRGDIPTVRLGKLIRVPVRALEAMLDNAGKNNPGGGVIIRAELIGSNTATAAGITAHSTTPVLALCRRLVAAGRDPAAPMHVYRGAVLALKVRSIGEAAGLTVEDSQLGRPVLRRWRARRSGGAASHIAQNDSIAPDELNEPPQAPEDTVPDEISGGAP